MDQETREVLDDFEEAFEEALAELIASGVTRDEVREYFGYTHLAHYSLHRGGPRLQVWGGNDGKF